MASILCHDEESLTGRRTGFRQGDTQQLSPTQSTAAANLQFLLPDAHEDAGDALVPKGRAQGWPFHFPATGALALRHATLLVPKQYLLVPPDSRQVLTAPGIHKWWLSPCK